MKKRILVFLVLIVIVLFSLTGCTTTTRANTNDVAANNMSNFKVIDGKDYLAYNLDTRVVYYMFSTHDASGYAGYGYAYFAPYLSENGKYCRYINDTIVEIDAINTSN